ncbi:sensor domain-containing diguanylate cyclase [Crenobacter cavernae]|uniref:diguanylate cyclase n=1 Tax=Crenobacter cavernae TaxID=2290923 RepID=A0A345Y670_9NEIS|nr:sensor domain-containing diguanylate cyclase [Crenobacter cavernae]AXK39422.1 sensor domain-containing diguanylate cyclase [Crenobacter cavernae]
MSSPLALFRVLCHRLVGGAPWLALLAWVLLLALAAFLAWQPFAAQRRAVLAETRDRIAARRHALDTRLWEVIYQVESQRRAAENGLAQPPSPPALMQALKTLPDGKSVGLEAVPITLLPERVGNVFVPGRREAISQATERELAMALSLFPMHKAALASTPELAWVYYHSVDGWCAASPWLSQRQLLAESGSGSLSGFMKAAADLDFLKMGMPARNPQRRSYWTPLYRDPVGKGWLMSYAAPVYEKQRFRGVAAADLTLHFLSAFLESGRGDGAQWLIVDRSATAPVARLVAASRFNAVGGEVLPDWRDFAGRRLGLPAAPGLQVGQWQEWGGYQVYVDPLDRVPWSLVYLVPAHVIDRQVLSQLRPVIGLLVLLLLLFTLVGAKLWQAVRELQRRASTDGLTGVSNRRAFFETARREQARHLRLGQPFSLLMIDIDHFKQVNDLFGHAAGDRVLKEFSALLCSLMRAEDLFARLGGEEFACLLYGSDAEQAREVAERLCRIVSRTAFILSGGQRVSLTASFGVATAESSRLSLEELYQNADHALYRAKEAGRNRVEVAGTPSAGHLAVAGPSV